VKNDGQGGVEVLEGRLVRLNGVTVTGAGAWAAGTNYPLADPSGTTELRIDNSTDLVGAPIPGGAFDLVGVVGQYVPSAPFIGGYQVMPRSVSDIATTGPIIASVPEEESITPTALGIRWRTVAGGSTGARYGTTPGFELGVVSTAEDVTDHHLILTGLQPATIYRLQAFSVAGAETSFAPILIACTASPAEATGAVNVYFNQSVDTTVAWDAPALGNQSLAALLLTRINAARHSIDAALYSLSGSPGTEIAAALVAARGRGVRVRVICESDNKNTPPFVALATAGIPVVNDAFDPVNAGAGLMHNKFFVFDEHGDAPESVWVWTGSWNPTFPGTFEDHQNALEIQDVALARAYTAEFQEMWGADGDLPDQLRSRFGARKTDNTPHRFVIGGRRVEAYFSPTDRVTAHILSALDSARHSVAFALLTFTRTDLRTALVRQRSLGRKVRGILDNNTDSGTQYPSLLAGSVDVLLKPSSGYFFHHKYAVVDGEDPAWHPVTVTGSHNWSNAAEGSNNENTLLLHDGRIANCYLQEFAARYSQFGGTDPILVSAEERGGAAPAVFALSPNYPNPFNPTTNIRWTIVNRQLTIVKVFDLLGREVAVLVNEMKAPGTYTVRFDGAHLSSGTYICRLSAGNRAESRRMLLLK
jgi:phosphatidylserine/phosphatidylglycerophosphate/cardiolipin synthase-like enzyme